MIAPFVAAKLEKIEDLPGWQRFAAEAVHWGLYVMMIVLPASGLLMMAATAPDVLDRALGLSGFRDMDFVARAQVEHAAETVHFASVWTIMGLIAGHVGAALKHHFIDRDDVLARMIPALGPRPEPGGRDTSAARKAKTANAAR
jgi:cytochrome b561